tara:strand:- start:750 stop:1910 length:1161 start_codon:yes stop_codon:yes gene_type:complete
MKQSKNISILSIETSCDDTAIAIIKASKTKNPNFKVLSNIISSQIKVHKKWGGVYPTLAKREHQKNLVPVLKTALTKAKMIKKGSSQPKNLDNILEREEILLKQLRTFLKTHQKPDIDLISVTNGPGLEPCLWVGVNFARALSYYWDIPIITVNHIKAHIFVNNIKKQLTKKDFPALCLIVSGGHTLLFLMKDFGKYEVIGETKDDAAGECFDKTAKILGLDYPGGPVISKMASQYKGKESIQLPRPMIKTNDYDFSFSGLKTAVLYNFKKAPPRIRKSKKYIQEMCFQIQQSIIDVLIKKTIKASRDYNVKTLILGGGVTANQELRKQLKRKVKQDFSNIQLMIPDPKHSTDNALMIAIAGYFRWKNNAKENWKNIKANANLRIG